MNKKLFLGAILLGTMVVSTGALTSCIDNDEPEGITELRGAKAELLRAKAAVELAKAEVQKQEANIKAAMVATQEAITKQQEAIAKQQEAIAKQQEAKAEQEWAKAAYWWAVADSIRSEVDYLIAENNAEILVRLKNLETELLLAQNYYENTVAEIEAAKAVLTDEQAKKLEGLQDVLDKAWEKYTKARGEVLSKMDAWFKAAYGEEDLIESYEQNVVKAQATLDAENAVLAELNKLKDSVDPTEWDAEIESLDKAPEKAKLEIEKLNLEILKIKQSQEYKDAEDAKKAADKVESDAKNKDKYTVSPIKIEVKNSYISEKIKSELDADGNLTASYKDNEATYPDLTSDNEKMAKAIKAWEAAMKNAGISAEDLQVAECEKEAAIKEQEEANSSYNAEVEKFELLHAQYEEKVAKIAVPTKTVDDAVKAYNDALAALEAKVKAANKTYDDQVAAVKAVLETETAKEYAKTQGEVEFTAQKSFAKTWLANPTNAGVAISVTTEKTIAEIESLVKSKDSDIKAANNKLSADIVIANLKKESGFINAYKDYMMKNYHTTAGIEKQEKTWMENAVTAAKATNAYKDAVAAQTTANADAQAEVTMAQTAVVTAYGKLPAALLKYADEAKNLSQQAVDAKGKLYTVTGTEANAYTGVDAKIYIKDDDASKEATTKVDDTEYVLPAVKLSDDKKTYVEDAGHSRVVRTAISEEAVAALTKVAYNETYGADALKAQVKATFGIDEIRHTVPTVDECKKAPYYDASKLAAKIKADKKVAENEAKLAAVADAKTINEAIAAAKATLNSEKEAAKKTVKDAEDAAKAAAKAVTAMTKKQNDAIAALQTKEQELLALQGKLKDVVEAYYNSEDYTYVDAKGDIQTVDFTDKSTEGLNKAIKGLIEKQENKVKTAETELAEAEKTLERAIADDEFDAVAQAKLELENAQADLEVAKTRYEYALSQLNAYVAALAQ